MNVRTADGRLVPLLSGALSISDPDEQRKAEDREWYPDDRIDLRVYQEILDERQARLERHAGPAKPNMRRTS